MSWFTTMEKTKLVRQGDGRPTDESLGGAMNREIPLYTLDGVRDADVSVHPVTTLDGLGLTLTRFRREPAEDVVLLVHGLTSSTDMYVMPEHRNLVNHLLDNGFGDVWS